MALPKFHAKRLPRPFGDSPFTVSSVANPVPTSADLPPFPVSPVFVEAMRDNRCPHCDCGILYHSPDSVPEETISLNANATAMLNTVGEAFARIYGNPEYRKDHGKTLLELLRLFLLTPPAFEALKYDTRPGRVERGKTDKAEWVDVQDASTSADSVETPGPDSAPAASPPAPEGDALPPEVIAIDSEDPLARLYDETAEPGDIYGDVEGETHSREDE